MERPQEKLVLRAVILCLVAVLWSGVVPALAYCRTVTLSTQAGKSVRVDDERWEYEGKAATVTRGSRNTTRKVSRTIRYTLAGRQGGLKARIVKRIVLKYEIYVSGPLKGRIYRLYTPRCVLEEAEARYLYLVRLTVHTRSTLTQASVDRSGHARVGFHESNSFTIPRQSIIKRDSLSDLLRSLVSINLENYNRFYTITPGGYGTVRVVLP